MQNNKEVVQEIFSQLIISRIRAQILKSQIIIARAYRSFMIKNKFKALRSLNIFKADLHLEDHLPNVTRFHPVIVMIFRDDNIVESIQCKFDSFFKTYRASANLTLGQRYAFFIGKTQISKDRFFGSKSDKLTKDTSSDSEETKASQSTVTKKVIRVAPPAATHAQFSLPQFSRSVEMKRGDLFGIKESKNAEIHCLKAAYRPLNSKNK